MLNAVKLVQHSRRLRNLGFASAALVCALLVVFAVGSKLAWYQPAHSASHHLASTKIKPTQAITAQKPAPVRQPQQSNLLLAALTVIALPTVLRTRRNDAETLLPSLSKTTLGPPTAIRPPPAR